VLGSTRKSTGSRDQGESYIATPTGRFRIEAGDVLTVYGQQEKIAEVMS